MGLPGLNGRTEVNKPMQWCNSRVRYGVVAQTFHWVVVVLILAQYTIGIYAVRLRPGFEQLVVLARHKSIGLTVLGLAALRLGWRLISPAPALPAGMRRWQCACARASHGMLYFLLFALPLSGWLFSSASGVSVSWFGQLALPDLVPASKPLAHVLLQVHVALALALALTVGLHVAAALWHHLVRHDGVLTRMLPGHRAQEVDR